MRTSHCLLFPYRLYPMLYVAFPYLQHFLPLFFPQMPPVAISINIIDSTRTQHLIEPQSQQANPPEPTAPPRNPFQQPHNQHLTQRSNFHPRFTHRPSTRTTPVPRAPTRHSPAPNHHTAERVSTPSPPTSIHPPPSATLLSETRSPYSPPRRRCRTAPQRNAPLCTTPTNLSRSYTSPANAGIR